MDRKPSSPYADFGEVLRWYRKKAGFSQEQLAKDICTREYIRLIEKGKKIPTLYMIDAFSKKMGINLFDSYALIITHHDFDTHQKIETLNEAIRIYDDKRLFALANEYAPLPGFQSGAPLQFIRYAFSLYYANVQQDYEKAIRYAAEGLAVTGCDAPDLVPTAMLSVTDMSLLLVMGVNLCRAGKLTEGRKYLLFLRECAQLRITANRYIANRNRRYDINLFALTTYNVCEFFPNNAEENLPLLEESINLLNEYQCSNRLPGLLLYKAAYLSSNGKNEEAKTFFNAGYWLLASIASREEAETQARKILGESIDMFLSDLF